MHRSASKTHFLTLCFGTDLPIFLESIRFAASDSYNGVIQFIVRFVDDLKYFGDHLLVELPDGALFERSDGMMGAPLLCEEKGDAVDYGIQLLHALEYFPVSSSTVLTNSELLYELLVESVIIRCPSGNYEASLY